MTITLFEHQERSYAELGWHRDHPALGQIEQLNETAGTELVRLGHRSLRATQFVGVMRLGNITLQILPKIDFDPSGDSDATLDSRPYQIAAHSATWNLLYLLSYAQNLQIKEQDIAPLLARRSNWFELLTRLLAMDLHRLMKRGVEHAYVTVEETSPVMRGRWQLERQLTRRPYVRHIFDVAYDEFSSDTLLNQIFRFVVDRLLLRTQDPGNRRLLRDLREWLVGAVCPGAVTVPDLDRVHFTRLNERFRPAFNLARLFVENHAFQLSAGQHHTYAFVFDMNQLFETFVHRFIVRYRGRILPANWRDVRIQAQSQVETIYLAKRLPNRNPAFRLYPDILFTRPSSGRPVLILDTKYKQLNADRRLLDIAEDDVYQMLAYVTRLDCPRTLLLYPHWVGAPRAPVTFETMRHPSWLVAATVDLQRPLNKPDHLIQAFRDVLREVSHYGKIT